MTPIPAFIHLSDHRLRAAATGEAAPTVAAILRNKLKLDLHFVDGTAVRSLASGSSGKLVLKKVGDQAGVALALDTAWEPLPSSNASGAPLKYRLETLIDSTELRAALGTAKRLLLSYAIEWTENGETQTTADYDIELWNTSARSDDGTPTAPSTFWTRLKAAIAAGTGVTFADNESTQVRTINVTAGSVDAAAIAAAVNGSTAKTNLNGNDAIGLVDSEASNGPKKATLTVLKNWLKGIFDTLYAAASHTHGIADTTGLQTALDAKAASSALTSHTASTSNPHSVTKAQVGLADVDNTTDLAKPISTATQAALDAKVDTSFTVAGKSLLGSGITLAAADISDLATILADYTLDLAFQSHIGAQNPHGLTAAALGTLRVRRLTGDAAYYEVIADDGSTDGYIPRITTLD